jgi:hypothetical protein
MKAIMVPLDNRPVTYLLPRLVANIAGVQATVPPRHLMGTLQRPSNINSIGEWLDGTLQNEKPQALLVCLDSLLYGGLIPSRRSDDTIADVQKRGDAVARWKKSNPFLRYVSAQASIMRISDNYDNTEEKEYWNRFGREIFAWSELLHKVQRGHGVASAAVKLAESRIPPDIRDDYMKTRMRNFQVNRQLISSVKSGALDFLAFSQDDSGEFGLNVVELDKLIAQAQSEGVTSKVMAYAGADEVLLTLLSRWLISQSGSAKPRARLVFAPAMGESIPSRYEGQTIGESARKQATAANIDLIAGEQPAASRSAAGQSADFAIVVHTSGDRQGDHVLLSGQPDLRELNTRKAVADTIKALRESDIPVVLLDVAYSNGSDPLLVSALFDNSEVLEKLWGYAGWNTTGNTIGSGLAMAVARWFSATQNRVSPTEGRVSPTETALKQCLFVRLADDWAYQTQIRRQLSGPIQSNELACLMTPHFNTIGKALKYQPEFLKLGLPWARTFEVEIDVEQPVGIAT